MCINTVRIRGLLQPSEPPGEGQMLKANAIVLKTTKYNMFLSRGGGFAEFLRESQSIRCGTTSVQRESREVDLCQRGRN